MHRASLIATALFAVLASALVPAARGRAADGAVQERWTRYGTGLVTGMAIADLDGGGPRSLVVAGRGLGAIGKESLSSGRFRWANKWAGSAQTPDDGETAQALQVADLNGDGIQDALVGNLEALFAVDGRSGQTLWRSHDGGSPDFGGASAIATADFNGDGVQDAAFGSLVDDRVTVVDGRTGSNMWYYPRDGIVIDLAAGDLNVDGIPDVVVVGEVDAGFEVHAISGAGAPAAGVASALWVQKYPFPPTGLNGDPRVVAIGQVVAATAQPEVVVAGSDGQAEILDGITGSPLGEGSLPGNISDIALANVDADPDLEILAANERPTDSPGAVVAFDGTGATLWTVQAPGPVLDLQPAELAGAPAVVAVGGWRDTPPADEAQGFALAFDPRAATGQSPRIEWTADLSEFAAKVAVGTIFGRPTVAVGQGQESGVVGLTPKGVQRWFFRTGGRIEKVLARDLDGDGVPEIVEGADDATLAVTDTAGRLRWQVRVPGRQSPDVISVGTGNLSPLKGTEVVAGTWEFDLGGPRGRIHAYTRSGHLLWSAEEPGSVDNLLVSDLDRNGAPDVVTVTSIAGSAARFDRTGKLVWQREIDTRWHASLALIDANGDGTRDLIVGGKSAFGGDLYALDGRDGSDLWHLPLPVGVNWLSTTGHRGDGILVGDLAGRVYRLQAATGSQRWLVDPGDSSWDGGWSIDANGDGVPDVVSASEDGNARMLDGRDGHQLWAAPTDGARGLTVTTLRGRARPLIGLGTYGGGPTTPLGVFVFDARTGERLGSGPAYGMVLDVAPVNLDADPAQELVAAAGWQLVALDAGS